MQPDHMQVNPPGRFLGLQAKNSLSVLRMLRKHVFVAEKGELVRLFSGYRFAGYFTRPVMTKIKMTSIWLSGCDAKIL